MHDATIFIDLDGVLADFDSGVRELAMYHGDDDDEMWEAVSQVEHFYEHLTPISGSISMLNAIKEAHPGRVEILTAPPKPKRGIRTAEDDKRNWCKTYLGDIPVNIAYSEDKHRYCRDEKDILIDDRQSNIDDWIAAGGTAILHTSPEETIKALGLLRD